MRALDSHVVDAFAVGRPVDVQCSRIKEIVRSKKLGQFDGAGLAREQFKGADQLGSPLLIASFVETKSNGRFGLITVGLGSDPVEPRITRLIPHIIGLGDVRPKLKHYVGVLCLHHRHAAIAKGSFKPHTGIAIIAVIHGLCACPGLGSKLNSLIQCRVSSVQVTTDVQRGNSLLVSNGGKGGRVILRGQEAGEITTHTQYVLQGIFQFQSGQSTDRHPSLSLLLLQVFSA